MKTSGILGVVSLVWFALVAGCTAPANKPTPAASARSSRMFLSAKLSSENARAAVMPSGVQAAAAL